jgi:phytoene synthase
MTRDRTAFALAMSYAPPAARPPLEAMFALDDTLATILRTTREPIVGQMRLTWWYEALIALDHAPAPHQPVLQALEHSVLPAGVTGASLAAMTDGWEVLLDPEIDEAAFARFAVERGARLFSAAGTILGVADHRIGAAGEGWALVDLARGMTDAALAATARALADARFEAAFAGRWPRRARALGALGLLARSETPFPSAESLGPVRRVGRLAWHRLTGY